MTLQEITNKEDDCLYQLGKRNCGPEERCRLLDVLEWLQSERAAMRKEMLELEMKCFFYNQK